MGIEFKEGDWVKIKVGCSGTKKGEIIRLTTSDENLWADGCSCQSNWELVTVTQEAKPKFKVGDKVKAISASWGWGNVRPGDIGVIARIESRIYVDFPNHTDWTAEDGDLKLVEDFTKAQPDPYMGHYVDPNVIFKGNRTYQWGHALAPASYWGPSPELTGAGLLNKLSKLTSNRKETTMQKLTKALKRLFSADQAKMYEARLIKQDGSLTEAGIAAVIDFVSEQEDCKKFLLKEAQAIIAEEKEEDEE